MNIKFLIKFTDYIAKFMSFVLIIHFISNNVLIDGIKLQYYTPFVTTFKVTFISTYCIYLGLSLFNYIKKYKSKKSLNQNYD
jgi:hypothetical protein